MIAGGGGGAAIAAGGGIIISGTTVANLAVIAGFAPLVYMAAQGPQFDPGDSTRRQIKEQQAELNDLTDQFNNVHQKLLQGIGDAEALLADLADIVNNMNSTQTWINILQSFL